MLDWLSNKFKKGTDRGPRPAANGSGIDFAKARQQHKRYWTANAAELAALQAEPPGGLSPARKLRMLHLATMALLQHPGLHKTVVSGNFDVAEAHAGTASAWNSPEARLCRTLSEALRQPSSPFRPRNAAVWQGSKSPPEGDPPTRLGLCSNASLTHLGVLEIIRLTDNDYVGEVDFLPFGAIHSIILVTPALYRLGIVFLENGERIKVLVPLLYGLSWWSKSKHDQDGTTTRFITIPAMSETEPAAQVAQGSPPAASASSAESRLPLQIGIGHQDWSQETQDGRVLFGLSSVTRLEIPLDTREPDFDERCRARGIDPVAFRQQGTPQ